MARGPLCRPAAAALLLLSWRLPGPAGHASAFSVPPPPTSWAPSRWAASAAHVLEHLRAGPPSSPLRRSAVPLEELANVRIPGPEGAGEVLAHVATPSRKDGDDDDDPRRPVLLLLHEFFGLNPSIAEKAQALADDLGCAVVAPDAFRGEVTDFVPRAIWLALTTPQERVNDDLDAVCSHLGIGPVPAPASGDVDVADDRGSGERRERRLAVMGFCYGGGKAIRYTTQRRPDAATVVFYGAPVTDVAQLRRLRAPLCGAYGDRDAPFPAGRLARFRDGLEGAGVEHDLRVYEGVGHAFWRDVDQVRRGEEPQASAYAQCRSFLEKFFSGSA